MSASDLAAGAVRLVAAEGLAYHVDVHLPHDGGGKLGRCAAAPLRRCAAAPLRRCERCDVSGTKSHEMTAHAASAFA
jgi:hypothetical protein